MRTISLIIASFFLLVFNLANASANPEWNDEAVKQKKLELMRDPEFRALTLKNRGKINPNLVLASEGACIVEASNDHEPRIFFLFSHGEYHEAYGTEEEAQQELRSLLKNGSC